ncbi:P-loop containing nucleoside triphosphate hydrolase protein [Hysterangium stoloniferum]|nr:P-loop containing nucleoside triphosphate hydrolase protein [Hysterangium stoloniferum]
MILHSSTLSRQPSTAFVRQITTANSLSTEIDLDVPEDIDDQILSSIFKKDTPKDITPTLYAGSRYDWRSRASSRKNPGGLIDPPLPSKGNTRYSRRIDPVIEDVPNPWHEAVQNYKLRFLDLLKAEEEEERKLINSRLAEWPLDKLQKNGYCLTGLSAFWLDAPQFGKRVAAFTKGPGVTLPYHRFDNGTQILLSRLDPLKEKPQRGSIIRTTETEVRITFDEESDFDFNFIRIDLVNTDIAYKRMYAAIKRLSSDPQVHERESRTTTTEVILEGTYLRDILLSAFATDLEHVPNSLDPQTIDVACDRLPLASESVSAFPPQGLPGAFAADQFIQSWARRYSDSKDPLVVEGDPDLSGLNETQRRAVAMMLGKRVSLVQGPPGTGKTKTIIEAVRLLKVHFQVPQPLLVCTYTNVAVDNLVEGLSGTPIAPLRIGYGAKVKPSLLPFTLEYQFDAHPLKKDVDKLTDDVAKLQEYIIRTQERLKELNPYGPQSYKLTRRIVEMEAGVKRKRGRIWALKMEITRDIISKADVICTTCITAGSSSLRVIDFPVVFLDEASMSTEPASLIPLMKGSRHLALIGDHKQLPPVITSKEAQAGGLSISLFERLIEAKTVPTIMLDKQYRMHPSISRFPSREFYNYSLLDGTMSLDGQVSATLLPPTSSHLEINPETGDRPSVIFLDHSGNEEMKDRSRVNYNEARIVCAIIEDLLMQNPEMTGHDIGIIAPYAAQISLLTRLLKGNKDYRDQLKELVGPVRALQVGNIEVKTVDGFEGREKDVIIFSTVRNNASGHIGFLADRRRMNVGLTRAKRGLFIVGSVGTLKKAEVRTNQSRRPNEEREVWVRYMDWLAQSGAVKLLRGEVLQNILFPGAARTSHHVR